MHIKRFRFKKLFVALSLFFVLIPSYGRGWHFLEKAEEASDFYQIISSDQDSQYLKVWWWSIFRDKIKDTLADNTKFFYEVDCKNHFLRPLYWYGYSEAELVAKSPVNEDWSPVAPDSIGDSFVQAVCKKPRNDFFEPVKVDIKKELSSLRGNEDQSAIEESLAKGKWFLSYATKMKMDENNLITINFFDKASLRINKQYRQILAWVLQINPSSVTPLAIVRKLGALQEYDCDKQRFRSLNTFLLNNKGQVIGRSAVSKWLLSDRRVSVIDWVCDNESKWTATPVTVDFWTIDTIPEEWLVGIDE